MKVLITGITGFIGRNVASLLMQKGHQIKAIVRPGKNVPKNIIPVEADLANPNALYSLVQKEDWDVLLHIGALRGGRPFPKHVFYAVNVEATRILAEIALKKKQRFIFCSSVGVWGTIPKQLPATNALARVADTFYHYTKIEAENIIQNYVQRGLKALILRPSITYGIDDFGFPYTLIKLIDKKLLFLPTRKISIHLTNVHTLSTAFSYFVENSFNSGQIYTIADPQPVSFKKLVDFVNQNLHGKPYPDWLKIPTFIYDLLSKIATLIKLDLWKSRFELISKSWYYDVSDFYAQVPFSGSPTIPTFKEVVEWYKEIK